MIAIPAWGPATLATPITPATSARSATDASLAVIHAILVWDATSARNASPARAPVINAIGATQPAIAALHAKAHARAVKYAQFVIWELPR